MMIERRGGFRLDRVFLIAAAVFSFTQLALPQAEDADRAVLRRIKEIDWPKAYREQDEKLLDRILADEFQMVNNDGVWSNKEKELARVRTSKPSYDQFRFEIKRLDLFENGTAIVAGTGRGSGRDKDGAYTFEYQSSNVLIKRGKEWKAIASHVSGYKKTYAKQD